MLIKNLRKSSEILTNKQEADIQQPLAKDGYSNDYFDKLYGKVSKNPYTGTERDRSKRKFQSGSNGD
jgi:hypothetical protein